MKGITNKELKNVYPDFDDEQLNKLDEKSRIEIAEGLKAFKVSKILVLIALMFITTLIIRNFANNDTIIPILVIIWILIIIIITKNDIKKLKKALAIIEKI